MNILLVAPAAASQALLVQILHGRGHIVTQQESLAAALRAFTTAPCPLVIVDLALPEMNCMELCHELRRSAEGAWCEILVITAGNRAQDLEIASRCGADDYFARDDDIQVIGLRVAIAEHRVEDKAARRETLLALSRSESRFHALLESAPDAIVGIDPSGSISLLNHQLEKLSGYTRAELLGQPVEILVPVVHREAHVRQRQSFFDRPLARPMGTSLNLALRHKNGSDLPVDVCLGQFTDEGQFYALAAIRDITERRRMEEELRLAKEAAERAYERIRQDVQAAARVQRALLPASLPVVEGLQFCWEFHPCAELAGDGLNVFWLSDYHVGMYLLDVSGHGVAAALLSVSLARLLSPILGQSTLLRVLREDGRDYRLLSPAEVAEQLNRWFLANPTAEQFFTVVYGILDTRTLRLCYVSAGHPGFLHLSSEGNATLYPATGLPIGVVAEADYKEGTLELRPGDRLFFFSDGLTESFNPAGKQFGLARLRHCASEGRQLPLDISVRELLRQVLDWAVTNPADDLSVLALAVEAAGGSKTVAGLAR